jgi:uncharacterized protein
MKANPLIVIWLSLLIALAHAAADIPAFTPNIVDPHAYLTAPEKDEVNRLIQDVRTRADIHAAVYVLQALGDESIEAVAERAFRTWKLGQAGKDNGLLIVLAMGDRKMRIETGYGLEGDIPDAVARRILDEQLRPFLRTNQIKNGLVSALVVLAQKRNKDYVADTEFQAPALPTVEAPREEPVDLKRGFIWWGLFAFMVLGVHPIWARALDGRKERLIAADPTLRSNATLKPSERSLFRLFTTGWPIKLFLIVNPGVFIFILGMMGLISPLLEIAIAVGVFALLGCIYWLAAKKYASPDAFRAYLADQAAKHEAHMKRLVNIGHARLEPGGRYAYTASYYESERRRAASNASSSSSSSWSSSSGGGSSGGGGASSSW